MKTITLKLSDNECRFVNNKTHIIWVESCIEDGSGGVVEVLNVDKFRKFLKDEIDKCFPTTKKNGLEFSEMLSVTNGTFYEGSESQKQDNLKSIIRKLDKECA